MKKYNFILLLLASFTHSLHSARHLSTKVNVGLQALKQRASSLILPKQIPLELDTPSAIHMKNHPIRCKIMMPSEPAIHTACSDLMHYADQQSKENDALTFFHGQSWNWNLWAELTKKISEQLHNTIIDDNFTFLRFDHKEMLTTEQQEHLALNILSFSNTKAGLHNLEKDNLAATRDSLQQHQLDRKHVLCVNAALGANWHGSHSLRFLCKNTDMSTLQGRNNQTIEQIFITYNLKEEIKQLQKKEPLLFEKLIAAHTAASKYGNAITVSFPKEIVKKIVYPSGSGGLRTRYKGMDCPVEIIENSHKLPFRNEFGIILGPNMLIPEDAKRDGIIIKSHPIALNQDALEERNNLLNDVVKKTVLLKK